MAARKLTLTVLLARLSVSERALAAYSEDPRKYVRKVKNLPPKKRQLFLDFLDREISKKDFQNAILAEQVDVSCVVMSSTVATY